MRFDLKSYQAASEPSNAKLRAVRLREYLPPSAIAALRATPWDARRLKLHHLRAIIAGLV